MILPRVPCPTLTRPLTQNGTPVDPISFLVLAGVALASGGIGARIGWQRARKHEFDPICKCKHSFAFHDPKTGQCHALVRGTPATVGSDGFPTSWHKIQCTCRRYLGSLPPEQILESFTPPQALPDGTDHTTERDDAG